MIGKKNFILYTNSQRKTIILQSFIALVENTNYSYNLYYVK